MSGAAQSDIHLSLRGVTRVYPARGPQGPLHAMGPVDLDLRRGEFFSVVGPSGCGKSTLLDVASGLGAPTRGEVFFEARASPARSLMASAWCSRRTPRSPG